MCWECSLATMMVNVKIIYFTVELRSEKVDTKNKQTEDLKSWLLSGNKAIILYLGRGHKTKVYVEGA